MRFIWLSVSSKLNGHFDPKVQPRWRRPTVVVFKGVSCMRNSPISSVVMASFAAGALLGSVGVYSPSPGPGAEANEFIQSRQLKDSATSQPPKAQRNTRINAQAKQQEKLHPLAPIIVLLPLFAKQSKG